MLLCETNHVLESDYSEVIVVGAGTDAIHQSGKWYTNEKINQMLMERHLIKMARRGSHKNHIKRQRKRRLLSGLKQNPYITQTDLAKELSLSRRTVQRIMKELMNDGKIKRVGSTRTGHWEIND